jgi:hypothetical protein
MKLHIEFIDHEEADYSDLCPHRDVEPHTPSGFIGYRSTDGRVAILIPLDKVYIIEETLE